MNTDTIQMSLFDYFMEDEQFTILKLQLVLRQEKGLIK